MDDVICRNEDIPKVDLLSNKNAILLEFEYGGHVDYHGECEIDGKVGYKRFFQDLILRYIDDLDAFSKKL